MSSAPSDHDFPSFFSADYAAARERFLEAAAQAHAATESWEFAGRGPKGETLAIDVARLGLPNASRCLILSSGLHGTEGLFGSAVQLAFLKQLLHQELDDDISVLFLHGLNPYGFAWRRRVNEDNIDLNRNFLLPHDAYQGAHPLYRHVYQQFDPTQPPSRLEIFPLKAWLLTVRHGKKVLQASLPIGQYEFPKGLFFGGQGPAPLLAMLREQLPHWVGTPEEVVHLDFHTGLGDWGNYRLLMDVTEEHQDSHWYRRHAPPGLVESAAHNKTAYAARGTFGPWMQHHLFPKSKYRYTAAEFGTYGVVRVIKALFDELRAHYALEPDDPGYERAKRRAMEIFVPASPDWRQTVLQRGLDLCSRCLSGLQGSQPAALTAAL